MDYSRAVDLYCILNDEIGAGSHDNMVIDRFENVSKRGDKYYYNTQTP